jgi:hypothetical protein
MRQSGKFAHYAVRVLISRHQYFESVNMIWSTFHQDGARMVIRCLLLTLFQYTDIRAFVRARLESARFMQLPLDTKNEIEIRVGGSAHGMQVDSPQKNFAFSSLT